MTGHSRSWVEDLIDKDSRLWKIFVRWCGETVHKYAKDEEDEKLLRDILGLDEEDADDAAEVREQEG